MKKVPKEYWIEVKLDIKTKTWKVIRRILKQLHGFVTKYYYKKDILTSFHYLFEPHPEDMVIRFETSPKYHSKFCKIAEKFCLQIVCKNVTPTLTKDSYVGEYKKYRSFWPWMKLYMKNGSIIGMHAASSPSHSEGYSNFYKRAMHVMLNQLGYDAFGEARWASNFMIERMCVGNAFQTANIWDLPMGPLWDYFEGRKHKKRGAKK